MLRIGICDDEVEARLLLRGELEQLLGERAVPVQAYEFSGGEGLLGWLEKHPGELDLIFLDIEMKGLNGMETARRLRALDEGLQLAFVTGYSDYVYDGYAVGALGYLLKPPQKARLEELLARALAALYKGESQAFICRSGETTYRVARKDILYFASDKRQVQCVTAAKTYVFYGKLDEVEESLGDAGFVRVHQRYLVHAARVESVDGNEVRVGGRGLPVSRGYRAGALLALARAMLK